MILLTREDVRRYARRSARTRYLLDTYNTPAEPFFPSPRSPAERAASTRAKWAALQASKAVRA